MVLVSSRFFFAASTNYYGNDGTAFSYERHFLDTLTAEERTAWDASMVEMYAAMFVDEIVERGRTGAIALICGKLPDVYFPQIFDQAARVASARVGMERGDASFEYCVRRPTELPPAAKRTASTFSYTFFKSSRNAGCL